MRPTDEEIVLEAQRKLAEAGTFRAELDFRAEGLWRHPLLPLAEGDIILSGRQTTDIDRSRAADRTSATRFEYALENEGTSLRLKGESRLKGGTHYLLLENASETLFPGIDRLVGRWVRTDTPFIEFLTGSDTEEDEEMRGAVDARGVAELEKAFSSVTVFEVHERLEDETSNGEELYRFRVSLDIEGVSALLLRRQELRTGTPAEPEDFVRIMAMVESWGVPEGEVLIGKNDGRFRRAHLRTALEEPFGDARIEATLVLSRYGETVEIEAPDAAELESVLGQALLGRLRLAGERPPGAAEGPDDERPDSGLPEGTEDGADEERDSDGDGLPDSLESFYGADAWNPDTDADGWHDGQEIENGMDPVGPGPLFGFGL